MRKRILEFIYGLLWGMAHIVPGLSGGTLLVIFGCFDTVCHAFALNFKEIRKHAVFFVLFVAGAVTGIIGFVYAVTFMFDNFNVQTNMFFMGLIIGGIPLILRLAKEDEPLRIKCLLPFVFGLLFVLGFFFVERFELFTSGGAEDLSLFLFIRLIIGSFGAAVAMVVPGISGASMLIALGLYDTVIGAIKNIDFIILIPAGIGMLLGIVLGARVILYALKKSKLLVYSAILGMVIGSAAPLFPDGFGLNLATLAGAVCLLGGASLTWTLGRRE